MPADDGSKSVNVPTSDKLNDKPADKRTSQSNELDDVIQAWSKLPESIRKGILAMVNSFIQ